MAARRTVLFIDTSPKVGGGQVSLLALLGRLDRDACVPLLATPPGSGVELVAARLGVETLPLAIASRTALRTGMADGRFRGWHREPARLARAAREVRGWIRDRDVALVHANNTLAGLVAALAVRPGRLPLVFHHRVATPLAGPGRLAADAATRVVCVSEASRASLGRARAKARVIHDGVDVTAFDQARARAGDPGDELQRVVVIGRLSPEKGQDIFLTAARDVAAAVPRARFILAGESFLPGDDAFEARLRSMAASPPLAGRVHFTGFHADVPGLVAGAALVCVPSRREGLGIAALEAMAGARPVVAHAVGGLRETIVDGETGFLVAPGDTPRFTAAMTGLLSDPPRARAMGEAGRRRVLERFTRDHMAAAIAALHRELMDARD